MLLGTGITGLRRQKCYLVQVSQGYVGTNVTWYRYHSGTEADMLHDTGITGLRRHTCYLVQVSQDYVDRHFTWFRYHRGTETDRVIDIGITGVLCPRCAPVAPPSRWGPCGDRVRQVN